MIYLDSSVALTHIFAEKQGPPATYDVRLAAAARELNIPLVSL